MFTVIPVTQPSSDTKHPLLLLQSVHGDRYMFGKITEGAQRSITENKIRISKLQNIFLTGNLNWSCVGGLPGMILTIADQGKDKLCLHYGSELINYVVSTWRYFVFRFGIDLSTNTEAFYKDKLINVRSITVKASEINEKHFNKTENDALTAIISNMFPKNEPTSRYDPSSDPLLNVNLPLNAENFKQSSSTNYEIKFNPIRGRFKVDEAVKLGVPKGPLFAKLTKGESITLPDGTTVFPSQVLEKERQFAKLLIIDIPDDSYVDSFISTFQDYDCSDLGVVYYFLNDTVSINDRLIKFMNCFNRQNRNINHIVSHPKISPNNISFMGSTITLLKLKALQLESYNLPRLDRLMSKEFYDFFQKRPSFPGTSMLQSQPDPIVSEESFDNSKVFVFDRNTTVAVNAYTKGDPPADLSCEVHQNNFKFSWKALYDKHIKPLNLPAVSFPKLIESQLNVNNFNNSNETTKEVEVITLGTGSALPSKYRNVVSTLIKVPYFSDHEMKQRNIIFDAGENTIGTINRMFSSIDKKRIFKDLKLVYLSHLHADHHLGIISLLKEWYRHNHDDENAKIYLVTPWQYNKFVKEWLLFEDSKILDRIQYISCEHLINDRFVRMETKALTLDEVTKNSNGMKKRKLELDQTSSYRNLDLIRAMYRDLNMISFQTCKAIHCNWAYSNSVVLKTSSNKSFKISYSGDTRPNIDKFAKEIGHKSDLLIHEATLDNDLVEDAIKKRHCTINEAINVSNMMEVDKLILTHFSQRYPKAPQLDNNIEIQAKEYCFAFDGMIVNYATLGGQKAILPMLNKVFLEEKESTEIEEEED
ncbi:hypothetical protein KAFR_0H00380 [Kazachstania africana CBS 2517]|uniref:ribonuclease Z n=1 Tax=Kazachstania africana (strain ATCC 22294 / BCRC 22015 / CBS 2517 / CECT 1963 / NBRC 1671 / NRRL Y-8276) TaxID=1071382 RepID=H2AYP1_KAZAF|nr:hypothetical protein KAFR_0H00380 [Kazachstania africana CBS 2517]CCF59447.1 hypothetical protein KAFR_0H00380 [Kazachstania africana CBS 2517]